jgi:hypothetical protein
MVFFLDLSYQAGEGAEDGLGDLLWVLLRPARVWGVKVIASEILRKEPTTFIVGYGSGTRRSYINAYVNRHFLASPSRFCLSIHQRIDEGRHIKGGRASSQNNDKEGRKHKP